VSTLDKAKGQTSHRWPAFLPDDRHFVFWAGVPESTAEKNRNVFLGSIDGGEPRLLVQAESNALYAPPGFLLYLRDRSLMAQPFDVGRLKMTGDAVPVVEEVENPEQYRLGQFSVSSSGTLVYVAGHREPVQAVWFGAAGEQEGTAGDPADVGGTIRLSPSGQTLAEPIQDPQTKSIEIWLIDLGRGVKTRFTFDRSVNGTPVWSPDGTRLAWSSNAKGHADLYVKSSTGAGEPELLLASDADKFTGDWSRDGRFLTYTQLAAAGKSRADLWVLPMFGDRKPFPFLATPFNEANGVFSPDGRWLAYESDDSGRTEIYITAFPQGGGRWQVSQGGGTTPTWRTDGRAVYYATPEGRLMEAPVTSGAAAPEVGTPHEFSKAELIGFGSEDWTYAVAPKGDRVLALRPERTAPVPLTLVTQWTEGLRR